MDSRLQRFEDLRSQSPLARSSDQLSLNREEGFYCSAIYLGKQMFSFTRRDGVSHSHSHPRMRKMINFLNVLAHTVRRELRNGLVRELKEKSGRRRVTALLTLSAGPRGRSEGFPSFDRAVAARRSLHPGSEIVLAITSIRPLRRSMAGEFQCFRYFRRLAPGPDNRCSLPRRLHKFPSRAPH